MSTTKLPTRTDRSFRIEKGHAIPAKGARGNRKPKYPFDKMEVLDSFFIRTTDAKGGKAVRTAATTATRRLKPKRFRVRAVDGGVRTWRTA